MRSAEHAVDCTNFTPGKSEETEKYDYMDSMLKKLIY